MSDATTQQRLGEIGLDNFAPYLMNRIMGRYNASLRAEMMRHGLTTPKIRSLAVLAMVDGILIGELAVYAVVEHSTLTRALDGLTKDGLALREPDPDDARATRIFITPAGRSLFEELWPRMAEFYAEMFKDIPESERRAFTATLQKILKNIRVHNF
ncbi:MarR family winged helix-turn-helix transcriptional regulator [Halovulum sp. GXIMD14793]